MDEATHDLAKKLANLWSDSFCLTATDLLGAYYNHCATEGEIEPDWFYKSYIGAFRMKQTGPITIRLYWSEVKDFSGWYYEVEGKDEKIIELNWLNDSDFTAIEDDAGLEDLIQAVQEIGAAYGRAIYADAIYTNLWIDEAKGKFRSSMTYQDDGVA